MALLVNRNVDRRKALGFAVGSSLLSAISRSSIHA